MRQNINIEDEAQANAKAREILGKGVTSLGLKANADTNLEMLLAGIDLNKVEINLINCPKCALALTQKLVAMIEAAGAQETFRGSVTFNPFKRNFKHGTAFPGDIVAMAGDLLKAAAPVKGLRVLSVDSIILNNAGAYIYQELGYALAWGNEWMVQLTDAGFSAQEVATLRLQDGGQC